MPSATNRTQIKAAEKRQARDREIDRDMILLLMSKVDGRRWIWNILAPAHVYGEDGVLDPMQMAYDKGKKVHALKLMESVTGYAPEMYVRMMQENSGVKLNFETEEEENPDG